MINISFIKLIPSFLSDEDEEEKQTEGDHGDVQRLSHEAEAKGPLKVDAEGNQHAIRDERPMHPAEAVGKRDDDPRHEAEQRAVEYPFCQLCPIAQREQDAVHQHHQRANLRDDSYYQPAGLPQPAFA